MCWPTSEKKRKEIWEYYQKIKRRRVRGEEIKIGLLIEIRSREMGISKSTAWSIIKTSRERFA